MRCEFVEEVDPRLLCPKVVRCRDYISRESEFADELPRPNGLVTRDANKVATVFEGLECWPSVGVEVPTAEVFSEAGFHASLPLLHKVESGSEVLEDLAVVLPASKDSAEHGRECVAGNAKPVRPGSVFGGFVDQCLAHIEDHGSDATQVRPG
jgi:hypothetical protein